MSRIDLNIVATGNFSQVETSITRLRSQVAALNAQIATMGGINPAQIKTVQSYGDAFNAAIDRSGQFERHMVSMSNETQKFGKSLEQGRLRLKEYVGAIREYRRTGMGQIRALAREQVRMMNATTMAMPDGRAQVIIPRGVDEAIDKQKILNQEYRIFRQSVQGASTQLINWGKNTQWAGRQLTVGLTVPLTIFGAVAGKMFMDVDKELTRLAKVYGGTAGKLASPAQIAKIREETQLLGRELASSLGVTASEVAGLAADIAATGKEGSDLIESTRESVRLSVLGEVDRQEAMRATLAIQNVFKKDTEELSDTINFLNAVENQTSTSLQDLVTGIVKAGPVVQGLGGSVEDLAVMLVAMREGGVTASEAANAIKSSLASLINPTAQTTDLFKDFGINLKGIVNKNAGDLIGTLTTLQDELSQLDELSRQRAIEQLFGKFQFARINALLSNLGKAGSQTQEVFKIAELSAEQLAQTADGELKTLTESATMRFTRALESIKANLVPIGETFVEVGTMLLNVANKVFEIFNSLPEPVQNFVKGMGLFVALAGPVIMITGVLGNFFGYLIKGVSALLALKKAGRGVFEMFTPESIAARTATELMTQASYNQVDAINTLSSAIEILNAKLSETGMLMDDVSSSSNAVMAAAEADAMSIYSAPGYNPRSSDKGKLTGVERFHYYGKTKFAALQNLPPELANLTEAQRKYGLRTQAGFAGVGDIGQVQRSMGETTAIYSNAAEEAALRARVQDIVSSSKLGIDPELAFQSVTASKTQYMARQAEYLSRLDALGTLSADTVKELSNELAKTAAEGGDVTAKAELLVRQAIEQDQAATERYGQAKANHLKELAAITGDTEAFAGKAAVYTGQQEVIARDKLTAKGMTAKIGSDMATGVQTSMIALGSQYAADSVKSIETATKFAIGTSARTALSEGRKNGQKLATYTSAKGQKYMVDFTNGLERATVYAVDSKTGQIQRVLSAGQAKQSLSSGPAQAAIARYHAAADRLDIMTRADIDSAAAALAAAAGGATPGVPAPRPGRFARLRGAATGPAGMAALGSLSMISMFGSNEPGARNTGMDIAGGAGMGAAMGMMAGPKGAAIGAVIGALAGTMGAANSNMDVVRENAKKLADAMSVNAKSLNETAEFFGGNLRVDRASAARVLEGTGIRQQQLTKGQEYLATEAGQSFVDGFAQGIESYGFNNALDGISTTLANMIMQGAMTFKDAEGVAAALAEQMNMPTLTADVVGNLRSILGPDGRNLLEKPITVGIKLQEENARQIAEMQASVLESGISNIDPTAVQQVLTTALGPVGFLLDAAGSMDIPGISGWVRNLRGLVNEDYSGAVSGVTTLSQVIGNQLRTAYDNVNSSIQRYNELEKEASKMKAGPEKDKALAILETEKRKINELEQSYETMRREASSNFEKLLQQDGGMAAEYLNGLSESVLTMFEGTVEAPAAQLLKSLLSGMDQQLQADIMLTISSGQLSPTAAMSLVNLFGGGEEGAKSLNIVLSSGPITDTNELLLTAMQIEDEEVRKRLVIQYASEGNPGAAAQLLGLGPEKETELKANVEIAQQVLDNAGNMRESAPAQYALAQQDLEAAQQALYDYYRARDELATTPDHLLTAEQRAHKDRQDMFKKEAQTAAEYQLAMQELGKLNIKPRVNLEESSITDEALQHVNTLLNQILALPDSVAKTIDVDAVQANAEMEAFNVDWSKINSAKDLEKRISAIDDFSGAFSDFGINYNAFAALPDIVKSVILQYVTIFQTVRMAYDSATAAAAGAAGEAYRYANQAAAQASLASDRITNAVDDVFSASQGAGYTPSTSGGGRGPSKDKEDGGGGGGGGGNPYQDLIDAQKEYIDGIKKEREERQRILKLQEESLNFMLKQQSLQNQIARAKAEGNFAEAALLQAQKDVEREQRDRELAEDRRQRAEDKEIEKRNQIIEILEKGGDFADKIAAALKAMPGAIPEELGGKKKGKGKGDKDDEGLVLYKKKKKKSGSGGVLYRQEAEGGFIFGPGTSMSDSIPAMLSNGEYVIRASAVKKYGVAFLDAVNNGNLKAMAMGGMASSYPDKVARMAYGGMAMYNDGGIVAGGESSYNITVNVGGSNASANEIADEVMRSLERRDRMKRSVTRV